MGRVAWDRVVLLWVGQVATEPCSWEERRGLFCNVQGRVVLTI